MGTCSTGHAARDAPDAVGGVLDDLLAARTPTRISASSLREEALPLVHAVNRLVEAAGETRWIRDYTHAVRGAEGAVTAHEGYIIDVTAQVDMPWMVRTLPLMRLLPVWAFDSLADFFGITVAMDEFTGRAAPES